MSNDNDKIGGLMSNDNDKNASGLTQAEWREMVNDLCYKKYGVTADDVLGDFESWTPWYNDESPEDAFEDLSSDIEVVVDDMENIFDEMVDDNDDPYGEFDDEEDL